MDIITKIYNDILSKMRELQLKVDEILPMKWITLTYMMTLNPNEKQYVKEAINKLIEEGYVRNEQRAMDGLVLTQRGFELLYQGNSEEILDKIYNDILSKMRELQLKVDEILPMKWITLTYMMTLNPNEKQYVKEAINKLIEEGYVRNEQRAMDGLVLTEKGFKILYN